MSTCEQPIPLVFAQGEHLQDCVELRIFGKYKSCFTVLDSNVPFPSIKMKHLSY